MARTRRIIYPPVWLVIGVIAQFACNELFPVARFTSTAWQLVGGLVMVIGLALLIVAGGLFKRAETDLVPFRNVTALVTGGVYRFTGDAAAATAAIQGLFFDPAENRVAPGDTETTTFTITVNDGVATEAVDAGTTVISTSINDAPTLGNAVLPPVLEDTTDPLARGRPHDLAGRQGCAVAQVVEHDI